MSDIEELSGIELRRVKKQIWALPQHLELRFPRGFATEVYAELERVLRSPLQDYKVHAHISHTETSVSVSGIAFRQMFELIYRMRTVRDAMWLVGEMRVGGYSELKKAVQKIPWDLILAPGTKVSLRARSQGSRMFHEGGIEEAAGDLLKGAGYRIGETAKSETVVELTLLQNHLQIALGCYGRPGNERDYKRSFKAIAPLKDDLAACLLERTRRVRPDLLATNAILVPFAGSGTLAVEGFLATEDLPGGIFGRRYALEKFVCSATKSNSVVRARGAELFSSEKSFKTILAIENDENQSQALEENLQSVSATLTNLGRNEVAFSVLKKDVFACQKAELPKGSCLIPLNPPYGERLKRSSQLYNKLGAWIRNETAPGSGGFLLSSTDGEERAFTKYAKPAHAESLSVSNGGMKIRGLIFAEDSGAE